MTAHDSPDVDAAVAEELRAHHAVMIGELDRLTATLADAAATGEGAGEAVQALEEWIAGTLVPHADEEEATTYAAAAALPEGEPLIRSMLAEHELIKLTARHLSEAGTPIAAATYGRVLFDIFDSHQRKENDIILPLLVRSEAVSLSALMGSAHHHDHHH